MSRNDLRRGCRRLLRHEALEPRNLLTTFASTAQVFYPIQDAYVDSSSAFDSELLRVSSSAEQSRSVLTFDIVGYGATAIESATLRLFAVEGSPTVSAQASQGTTSNWTERKLTTANAPSAGLLLDTSTTPIAAGEWVELDVSAAVVGSGKVTLVLEAGSGSDPVVFSSREGDYSPQLSIISDSATMPADTDLDDDVDLSDLLAIQRSFGTTNSSVDANGDGIVDDLDIEVWQTNVGASTWAAQAVSAGTYGATPDDGISDHAAIQSALDNNASVSLAAGEYILDDRVNIPAGRTLQGPASGAPAVLRVRFDTGISSGNYALSINGDSVTIRDLVIDKDFVDGSYGTGIFGEGRDFVTIDGVEIRDYSVRYGIHLISSDVFEISNSNVHSFLMNQGGASAADMISDSPAGIRITRSSNGSIRDSTVRDIEVGPMGITSISELVPSYGPQNYQSDAITILDSTDVDITDNQLWNSGELIDLLVSDNITVTGNTVQMAYLWAVKVIGTQSSLIQSNYIADGALGLWMGDHSSGEQATGNVVNANDFVNNGSRGVWDISASVRNPLTVSGIFIDNDADNNTISNNQIYDYYGYLQQFIRQGTGNNAFPNNNGISSEFGPQGGGDATLIGDWTEGLTASSDAIDLNRALVFFAFAEDSQANTTTASVSYGGRPLVKYAERGVFNAGQWSYVSFWVLTQDSLNMAANNTFSVNWSGSVDTAAYGSVFAANVYQPSPVFSQDTGATTSGSFLNTSPRPTNPGDLLVYGGVGQNPGDFTPLNGFSEAIELAMTNADASVGLKLATGTSESVSLQHSNLGGGAVYMGTLRRNPTAAPIVSAVALGPSEISSEYFNASTPAVLAISESGNETDSNDLEELPQVSVAIQEQTDHSTRTLSTATPNNAAIESSPDASQAGLYDPSDAELYDLAIEELLRFTA